jgi:hypothetical protein
VFWTTIVDASPSADNGLAVDDGVAVKVTVACFGEAAVGVWVEGRAVVVGACAVLFSGFGTCVGIDPPL